MVGNLIRKNYSPHFIFLLFNLSTGMLAFYPVPDLSIFINFWKIARKE